MHTTDTPATSGLGAPQSLEESDGHPARPRLGWASSTPPARCPLCPSPCLSWGHPPSPGLCELCPHARDSAPSMQGLLPHPRLLLNPGVHCPQGRVPCFLLLMASAVVELSWNAAPPAPTAPMNPPSLCPFHPPGPARWVGGGCLSLASCQPQGQDGADAGIWEGLGGHGHFGAQP